MRIVVNAKGFSLVEVAIGAAVFLIFALGIFSTITLVFKTVYQSRLRTLQTAVAVEQLEVVRNIPFADVGVVGGVPSGVLTGVKTIERNGMMFSVTTTVRNIDDPFDGTATSVPADTAPADFKLVEVAVQCVSCEQFKPFVMTTHIAPKGLETATNNGSLFIQVVDAGGLPVSSAVVEVSNSSSSPAVSLLDVTDQDGWLYILDTPTGTLSYNIVVSKSGFSTDYTVASSPSNPSPTKLPASVTSQNVTNVYFAIDQVGQLNFTTMSPLCSPIGGAAFSVRGQKQIGSLPVVYKYNEVLTANGSGEYVLTNAEWDTYFVQSVGSTYDLAGTIPMSSFSLLPGATQDVSVILRPHTTNSLLVKVKDAGTGLPLSGANVRLSAAGYDQSLLTGLGFVQQTDWSGGAGQDTFVNSSEYFADDARVDVTSLPGDILLKNVDGNYLYNGYLESSTFDLGTAVNFSNIYLNPTSQATSTGERPIEIQFASSNSSTPASWEFLGPDGTADTYYTATSTVINSIHNGDQYMRYLAFLRTDDATVSPNLSDVSITYTTSCVAPGQSFFNGFSSDTYTIEVSKTGYTTNSGSITVSGNLETEVNLSPL